VTRYSKRGPVSGVSKWQTPAAPAHTIPTVQAAGTVRYSPRHGVDRASAARVAGERGVSARPMPRECRESIYYSDNGGRFLTPKQRRRVEHKARRAYVRNPTRATGSPEAGVSL
jgi:hypothetical protein